MPSSKSDDDDDFTKIDAESNSEDEAPTLPQELKIPAPLLQDLPQKAREDLHNIFEPPPTTQPPSREVSMMATAAQPSNVDKIRSLFFGCLFCCRSSGNIRTQTEESNHNKKKGLRNANG